MRVDALDHHVDLLEWPAARPHACQYGPAERGAAGGGRTERQGGKGRERRRPQGAPGVERASDPGRFLAWPGRHRRVLLGDVTEALTRMNPGGQQSRHDRSGRRADVAAASTHVEAVRLVEA
jgi:hypothetical protein